MAKGRNDVGEASVEPASSASERETLDALVASFSHLDGDQLRLQWRNHLGGVAPAHLPNWLIMRVLAYRIQASAHGDLAAPAAPSAVESIETGDLIDFILNRFHETHRRELPELLRLARRVEIDHHGDRGAPVGLARLIERIQGDLARHMGQRGDRRLPPDAAPPGCGAAAGRLSTGRCLHAEHDGHAALLLALMTNDFACPDEAGREWRALYAGLEKFADDLAGHVRLEDSALFPRFERRRGPTG